MLTVEQALDAVLKQVRTLPALEHPLPAAVGCVLDEDVAADIDSPPFDKALVDGYAVRTSDLAGPEPPARDRRGRSRPARRPRGRFWSGRPPS